MNYLPKVLLIDDEVDYLHLLTALLRKRGFDVYSSSSGEDAITITRNFKPDVIVLDVRLGNEDGRKICWEIKTEPDIKDVTIILHSAFADIENGYKTYYADEFILKPTEIDYLVSRINAHLKQKNGD